MFRKITKINNKKTKKNKKKKKTETTGSSLGGPFRALFYNFTLVHVFTCEYLFASIHQLSVFKTKSTTQNSIVLSVLQVS